MFASTVGFLTELRFLRQRPSYMHCCRALTLALAKLSCLVIIIVAIICVEMRTGANISWWTLSRRLWQRRPRDAGFGSATPNWAQLTSRNLMMKMKSYQRRRRSCPVILMTSGQWLLPFLGSKTFYQSAQHNVA